MKSPRLRQAYSSTRIAVPNGTPSEWLAVASRLAGSLHGRMNSGSALEERRQSRQAGIPANRKGPDLFESGPFVGKPSRIEGRRLQVSVFCLRREGGGG